MPAKCYVTCKAAVWKDGKLLLQKEETDDGRFIYDLPGGRIEAGEDPKAALRREVMEEIGVELLAVSQAPVKVWSTMRAEQGVVALLYQVTLASEAFDFMKGEEIEVLETAYLSKAEFEPTGDHIHKSFILEYYDEHRS